MFKSSEPVMNCCCIFRDPIRLSMERDLKGKHCGSGADAPNS